MKTFATFALTLLTTGPVLFGQVLLNEDFSDNERATQNLPGSSTWRLLTGPGSTTSGSLSASSGALVYTQPTTAVTANAITFFTASGSPRAIADGETLNVSFTLSLSSLNASTNANTIRFGLFNSGATRVSTDSTGAGGSFSSSTFNNDGGYQIGFNPGSTATLVSINERNASSSDTTNNVNLFSSNTNVTTSLATSSLAIGASANTPFNVSFSIARSGTSYNLSSTINGQTISFTDNSISAGAFDQFALQYSTNAVGSSGSITLDHLNIAVIPEPSTYALLLLGGAGLLVLRRMNRR